MASPGGPRRRPNGKRPALTRTNTLFGAIKNIVTAPLSWFASTDDFEDARDSTGKRRRLGGVLTEPVLDSEEHGPRTKRMRMGSATRELRREGGQNYVRSTLSPLRNLSISRTMSIDPPPRSQSRDLQSQRPLDADSSMDSLHPLPTLTRVSLSVPRDLSMPHSRPPFRMRTSLTPQRERSEPPPLHLLRAHPTFVKPPPLDNAVRPASIEPAPTLGSLVDSVRRTESPTRSLLFGGKTQAEPKSDMSRAQKALHELEIYKTPLLPTRLRNASGPASITGVPDLFRPRRKLVLMKDEGRASDRKLGRKETVSPGKNGTKPYAGESSMKKMLAQRKMELEEEEDNPEDGQVMTKAEKVEGKKKDDDMDEDQVEPLPSSPPKEVPPPAKDDWYSLASRPSSSSSSTAGSSLRVGRAKSSRNHISRPTARTRAKFSAAFEEEADEVMVDEDKEREELEAAAKNAPVFNIPTGFSFAKDVKPIELDATNAKEPPIKSLPYSFGAPATPAVQERAKVEAPPPIPAPQPSLPPLTTSPFLFGVHRSSAAVAPVSLFGPPPTTTAPSQPTEARGTGVPNFFARSAAFNKPLEIKTPPLTFGAQSTESPKAEVTAAPSPPPSFAAGLPSGNGTPSVSSAATSLFGSPAPVKDVAKTLGEGEKKVVEEKRKDEAPPASISIFGTAQEKSVKDGQAPVTKPDFFGDTAKQAPSLFVSPSVRPTEAAEPAKPSPFTFGAAPPSSTAPTTSTFGAQPTAESTSKPVPSLFGAQSSTSMTASATTSFVPSTSGSLFGDPAIIDASKPVTSLFGTTGKPKTDTEKPTAGFTAPSMTFTFGQQPSSTTTIETPKPMVLNGPTLFGSIVPLPAPHTEAKAPSPSSFMFGGGAQTGGTGTSIEAKPASPAPFTFGVSTSDKETNKAGSPAPPAAFTFGAPSTPKAPEKTSTTPFTFGSTPSASPVLPQPVFAFGGSGIGASTTGDVSKPLQVDRPVTPPPKNNVDSDEVRMEESPTREIQQANKPSGFTGFSFGTPSTTSGSVLFGGPTSAPPATNTPFPFGGGSTGSSGSLFAAPPMKESKSEGLKPLFSFGGQTASSSAGGSSGSTGFSFGQTNTTGTQRGESPRPSTGGSFGGFGAPSTPAPITTGFNFGQPAAGSPFGQQQQQSGGGSAPSSPSTFQTGAFNFGAATSNTGAGTGFGFGSQPASPATGNSNLPQTGGTPFGGGGSGFGSSAPSSPFTAPTQIQPSTSSGGTLFTIGAAPPPPPGGSQGRAIKKLPNRSRIKR